MALLNVYGHSQKGRRDGGRILIGVLVLLLKERFQFFLQLACPAVLVCRVKRIHCRAVVFAEILHERGRWFGRIEHERFPHKRYFLLRNACSAESFDNMGFDTPGHWADKSFRRRRSVSGTDLQYLRHQRRIIGNPITHDNASAAFSYTHFLLCHIMRLRRKHRAKKTHYDIKRLIFQVAQIGRIPFLKPAIREAQFNRSPVSGGDQIGRNIHAQHIRAEFRGGHCGGPVAAAEIQDFHPGSNADALDQRLTAFAHRLSNAGEIPFFPKGLVWIYWNIHFLLFSLVTIISFVRGLNLGPMRLSAIARKFYLGARGGLNQDAPGLASFASAKQFGCMKRIIWLGIAFVGLVTPAMAEPAGALVDKMVAAYGGEAALEKIAAIREEGKVEATMRVGSSGMIVRTYARQSRLRIQIGDGPKFTEVRVLDGAKGWRNGQESTGVSCEAMVLQAARLDLPWLLMKNKAKLADKGLVERDGRRLQVLELPLESGSVSAGIDPMTGHILFSSGTTKTGSMTFETSYDDFRKVEGVLFAFKETNMAQGTKTAETILSKIEFLKEVPGGAFSP